MRILRLFSSQIALIMVLICLLMSGGCKKTDQNEVIIKFSSWGSESEVALLRPILKDFEQKNPDIKIDFVHVPQNYFQKLHLLIASNLAPDVMFVNNINSKIYAQSDVLEDLTPYFNKNKRIKTNDFFPKALDAFKNENKLWAVPRDVSNLVIYYNKDLFDKYNIKYPSSKWTTEEFLGTAQKLTKDLNSDGKTDIWGITSSDMSLLWLPYLWSNGGGIINDDSSSVIINKPESVESLQFYADLMHKYKVAPTKAQIGSAKPAQMFIEGRAAMHLSGRWLVPRYRKDIKFDWDIARFPYGRVGSVVDADSSGWAMSKNSKHKEQAWRLIEFLASKDSIKKLSSDGLIVPARIDIAYSDNFLKPDLKPKNAKIFVDIIPDSIPTPSNENYQEINDLTSAQLEPLWYGNKKAKEVVTDDFVAKLKKLIK